MEYQKAEVTRKEWDALKWFCVPLGLGKSDITFTILAQNNYGDIQYLQLRKVSDFIDVIKGLWP